MNILITGITGTLGREVLKKLVVNKDYNIFGLTRNEHCLHEFKDKCTMHLGDIRDRDKIIEVTRGMDVVFHFAALKHVDLMQNYSEECIKTNLDGTRNLVYAQKYFHNKFKIIFTSTDKAMYPINVYGQCKAISERLIANSSHNNYICRYGNVVGSNGSIFSRLPEMLRETNVMNITDPSMTRFWMTKDQASDLVLNGLHSDQTGLAIPKIKAANVYRMMQFCAEEYGYTGYETKVIGLRAGEKLHEDLDYNYSSETADKYSDNEIERLLGYESGGGWSNGVYGSKIPKYLKPFRDL